MPENYTPAGAADAYVIPSLDDPADGPHDFRQFADSIPGNLSAAVPVRVKSEDYTLALDDEGAAVFFDTTESSHAVTVPAHADVAFPVGTVVVIGNVGTNKEGNVQITPADGVTVRDTAVRKVALNRMAAIMQVEEDFWVINAGTGGGPAPGSVPSPPKLVNASGGPKSAYLGWEPPKDDGGHALTTYTVEKSTNGVDWSIAATRDGVTTSAQVGDLTPGTKYQFRVKAANIIGLSDPSNVLEATPTTEYNKASGGVETTYTKAGTTWKVHTFKNDDTFKVEKSAAPFKVLIVAGGGGGGPSGAYNGAGGGGAGGLIYDEAVNLSEGDIPVVIGAGGAGAGANGKDTKFGSSLTAVGGGAGGANSGQAGGSGGGAGGAGGSGGKGVSGQGFDGGPGGNSDYKCGSGGGGAGEPGHPYTGDRNGGDGRLIDITGTATYYAGGGGGGSSQGQAIGQGGKGGGGAGGWPPNSSGGPGAGVANTGGGGGGGGGSNGGAGPTGAPGGSGIVIVSYEVEPNMWAEIEGGVVTTYSQGGITYKQHEIRDKETLIIKTSGLVETFIAVGGGGGGGGMSGQYRSGGGGAGGSFYRQYLHLDPQTITATIGAGGNAGPNGDPGKPGSFGGDTTFTLDGVSITCGGGGPGPDTAGRPGANGGGTGGIGGTYSGPGRNSTGGASTLTNVILNNVTYGAGGPGGSDGVCGGAAHTGSGGGNAPCPGGSGVVLVRYPILSAEAVAQGYELIVRDDYLQKMRAGE